MSEKFLNLDGLRVYDSKLKTWVQTQISQAVIGVMHFKSSISSASALPQSPEVGDVYISTASFTYNNETIEPGDLFVRAESGWTIIQGNLTLDRVTDSEINSLFTGE